MNSGNSLQKKKVYLFHFEYTENSHYENTPIQIYFKFNNPKRKKKSIKNSDMFHIPVQNINCGYLLEPPRRGGSNEYPQSIYFFFSNIRK